MHFKFSQKLWRQSLVFKSLKGVASRKSDDKLFHNSAPLYKKLFLN